jgi:hypothetical protein
LKEFTFFVVTAVGHCAFGVPPYGFYRVEFGSVRWECLEVQTLLSSAKVSYRLAAVNSGIVPDYSDVSSKVSEKMAEKGSNVAAENVLGMKTGVQANSLPFWADRKSGDN